MLRGDVATLFVRWRAASAVFHRGYWLVASLYLVRDAHLSAFQLLVIGTAQGLVSLVFEVPAGVMADTISRKLSLVVGQLLMGTAIVITGTVTSFAALVSTQMLWGIAWTFVSGADVAWATDEVGDPARIDRALTKSARLAAGGSALGLIFFGGLAWLTSLGTSIICSGLGLLVLTILVTTRLPEHNFVPTKTHRVAESFSTLRRGVELARNDRQIVVVFAATFLLNGAAEAFGRLYAKRLLAIGFPVRPDPIVWYTALGLAMLLAGATALRTVEQRIDDAGSVRVSYAVAALIGAVGVALLALAPDASAASIGALLMGGVALTVTRAVATVWVNRQTTNDVRATVHSLLAQAEYFGEIIIGLSIALIARAATVPIALVVSVVLLVVTALVALSSTEGRLSGAGRNDGKGLGG